MLSLSHTNFDLQKARRRMARIERDIVKPMADKKFTKMSGEFMALKIMIERHESETAE